MPRKRDNFSEANIAAAVNAVLKDGLSKKSAALKFSVSRSTLQHRLKNPECKKTCGPATVLSEEEESVLENCERIPFVLSSKMWQNMYEQKEAHKKDLEAVKENNRKKRLENKLIKTNKTNLKSVTKKCVINKPAIVRNLFNNLQQKKAPETVTSGLLKESESQKLSNDVISECTDDLSDDSNSNEMYKTEGLCFKYANNLSHTNNGLECEFCSHLYHLKCLNSKEYCDLGLGSTILFICNTCQKNLN